MIIYRSLFFLYFLLFPFVQGYGQEVVESYESIRLGLDIDSLIENYGSAKVLPVDYQIQALLALSHYPELKDVRIKFKIRKKGAPFVSRPTIWSTFFRRSDKRAYLILIRTGEHPLFDPILMENMPFEAQIGVLGHELAHTLDFKGRGLRKMLNVIFGNLSWKYLDNLEFKTDRSAIEHGLGFQLLAWSRHAIKTLRINEPKAIDEKGDKVEGILERERYMRPNTIKKEIQSLKLYNGFRNSSLLSN